MNTDSIVFQKDGSICTGFFYAQSTPLSIKLFDHALQVINKTQKGDQASMIQTYKDLNLTSVLLPSDVFCSGEVFFSNNQYPWDPISPSIIMIHNNYIRGQLCKQLRMIELGYIKREVKDEESSRYLTAESLPSEPKSLRDQLALLASLANRLNRTVILPPIPCSIGKGYCTICNHERVGCYADILERMKYGFRESVRYYFISYIDLYYEG